MRRRFLRSFPPLALFGIATAAATSAPASTPIAITPPKTSICPAPTLAVCQAQSMQSDTCSTTNHAACAPILQNEFNRQYSSPASAGGTQGDMILPTGSPLTGAGFVAPGVLVPYDQRRIAFQWNSDTTFESLMARRRVPSALGRGFAMVSLGADLSAHDPAAWEANGGTINGVSTSGSSGACAEYAYEKYYDYERFADAAASCLNDYICIANVGFLATSPGLAKPSLNKRDGTPMAMQLAQMPAVDRVKNAFFGTQTVDATDHTVKPYQVGRILRFRGGMPIAMSQALMSIEAQMGGSYRYTTPNRFAWHKQMHDKQAAEGLTLDQYASMEARMKAYEALLEQYVALSSYVSGADLDHILNGQAIITCSGTSTTPLPGGLTPILSDPDIPNNTNSSENCTSVIKKATFPFDSLQSHLQDVATAMGDLLLAEWNHVNPVTHVIDHGCLDPNSNRCDWSPKLFTREYVGLLQGQREADFDRCVSDTGDNLTVNPSYPYAPKPADLASTAALETFLTSLETQFAKDTADVPWLQAPVVTASMATSASTTAASAATTGVPQTVGDEDSGGHSIGDPAWFSADYSYDSLWSLHFKQANNQICSADGEVRGALRADVGVLGSTANIVDAYFDLVAGKDGNDGAILNTHLKMFGADLYAPVTNKQIGGSANAWNLSQKQNLGGPHASTPPMPVILGIPIVISAGVNLQFGVVGDASATVPQTCIPNQADGTYKILQAHGAIAPYVGADGWLSAAVDVGVASAGVRANLNLITAKLPIRAELSLDFNAQNMAEMNLDASTNLELSELSGSVDAFGQVGPFSTDIQLFSWDGLHQTIPIYTFKKSYPLTAMNYWLHKHGG